MADLAAIGLASFIVTFIDFGIKVATRLYGFEQTLPLSEDPKLYRDIWIELLLLLDTLRCTEEQADQGKLNDRLSKHYYSCAWLPCLSPEPERYTRQMSYNVNLQRGISHAVRLCLIHPCDEDAFFTEC